LPSGPKGNALYYRNKLNNPTMDSNPNPILVSTGTILDLELPKTTFSIIFKKIKIK